MRLWLLSILVALAFNLAGCSIHPSPRDVMPRTTVIVDRIKCETTHALIDEIIYRLESGRLESEKNQKAAYSLAQEIRENPEILVKFDRSRLPGPKAIDFYDRYLKSAIAYDFTLTGLEDNSLSAEVDFARVATNGMVSLPLAASDDHMRASAKTFTIAETFQSLLANLRDCPQGADEPNFDYPISGHVGIHDIIRTFIDLNEEKDLTLKAGAPSMYADSLTFTTMVSGGAIPKLVLTSPAQAFHLTGAMLNAAESRKDTDVVIIGLSLPPKPEAAKTAKDNAKGAILDNRHILFENSLIQFFTTR